MRTAAVAKDRYSSRPPLPLLLFLLLFPGFLIFSLSPKIQKRLVIFPPNPKKAHLPSISPSVVRSVHFLPSTFPPTSRPAHLFTSSQTRKVIQLPSPFPPTPKHLQPLFPQTSRLVSLPFTIPATSKHQIVLPPPPSLLPFLSAQFPYQIPLVTKHHLVSPATLKTLEHPCLSPPSLPPCL